MSYGAYQWPWNNKEARSGDFHNFGSNLCYDMNIVETINQVGIVKGGILEVLCECRMLSKWRGSSVSMVKK